MTDRTPDQLRDVPGDDLGADLSAPRGLREWWRRLHLVPLIVLMLAVIAATVTGVMTQNRLRDAATAPPLGEVTSGTGLPASCQAPEPAPAAPQPWVADARVTAEQAFEIGLAGEASAAVVEGRDGWVFWGDVQAENFSQALGRRVLSQDEMDDWYASMSTLRDRVEAEGMDFVIQVVPAKWSIHPEQLPDWSQNLRGATTLDYLRYVHPDLPILDMRDGLRAATATGSVYTPLQSHWTRYGGAVGWGLLAECLTAVDAERYAGLAPLGIERLEPAVASNEFADFGFSPVGEEDTVPVWAAEPSAMTTTFADGRSVDVSTVDPIDLLDLPGETVTANPQSTATALILRDSQGSAIAPGWQAGFARTWQVAHNLDHPEQSTDALELAREHRPDVVIFQIAERHLNAVPPPTV